MLAAFVLVVLSGSVTAWLVASTVSPGLFHTHLTRAGMTVSPQVMAHAEQAFASSNGLSLAFALLASLVVAVAVAVYLTRRLDRSLRPMSAAAVDVSRGRYDVRVPLTGLGSEIDDLAAVFNRMAGQLQRVERTRSRLLGDLAHELRTPVATLDAYLDGLEDGVATLDASTLEILRTQTRRLARLAEDVSAVSHAEEQQLSLALVPAPPGELVAAAVAVAADRYAERGVILHTALDPRLPLVAADPDRMGQILGNLLDNALRHTPPGGSVTVSADVRSDSRTDSRSDGRTDSRSDGRTDGWVRLQVRDTGVGVAPEHLPHLFERFYRVDAARDRGRGGGGSGIGLAIVKALAEAHGGCVDAASDGPGTGATFTVTLPPVR